jgi:hypothetical protein
MTDGKGYLRIIISHCKPKALTFVVAEREDVEEGESLELFVLREEHIKNPILGHILFFLVVL